MDPASWRKEVAKISLRGAAKRLGVASATTVHRYERGEKDAPNSIAMSYERISKDAKGNPLVTAEDLARVRRRFLKAQESTSV